MEQRLRQRRRTRIHARTSNGSTTTTVMITGHMDASLRAAPALRKPGSKKPSRRDRSPFPTVGVLSPVPCQPALELGAVGAPVAADLHRRQRIVGSLGVVVHRRAWVQMRRWRCVGKAAPPGARIGRLAACPGVAVATAAVPASARL